MTRLSVLKEKKIRRQRLNPPSPISHWKMVQMEICLRAVQHEEVPSPVQSILASARRREGVRLFARRTLGVTILVLRPESFLRATMTGAEDLVTK